MNTQTNEQFKEQIAIWQLLALENKVKLNSGLKLPDKCFHVFLGVGYSTFKKMLSSANSARPVPPYISKMIRYVNLLETNVFITELKLAVVEYHKLYTEEQIE